MGSRDGFIVHSVASLGARSTQDHGYRAAESCHSPTYLSMNISVFNIKKREGARTTQYRAAESCHGRRIASRRGAIQPPTAARTRSATTPVPIRGAPQAAAVTTNSSADCPARLRMCAQPGAAAHSVRLLARLTRQAPARPKAQAYRGTTAMPRPCPRAARPHTRHVPRVCIGCGVSLTCSYLVKGLYLVCTIV